MNKHLFGLLAVTALAICVNISFAAENAFTALPSGKSIVSPVEFPKEHLQGIESCSRYIYWVFSKHLVKTDLSGQLIRQIPLHKEAGKRIHGGSPVLVERKLYVPYCGSGFNAALNGKPSHNYVQVYDLDLNYIKSYPVPELEYGAGAMSFDGKSFFITGGRPADMPGNEIFEYSRDFKLLKKHKLAFNTFKGIQTLVFDGKYFYAGCYGGEYWTYRISSDFKRVDYLDLSGCIGLKPLPDKRMLAGKSGVDSTGRVYTTLAVVKPEQYLMRIAVVQLGADGGIFCNGKPVAANRLRNMILNGKCNLTVVRCAENTPLKKVVDLQQFIPGKFILEFSDQEVDL